MFQVGGASHAETQREEMKGDWCGWNFSEVVRRLIQDGFRKGPKSCRVS